MKVQYCDDEQKGPGYGYFLCTEESFLDGSYTASLQRSDTREYLGQDGLWGEAKMSFMAEGRLRALDCLQLNLLPHLQRSLVPSVTYRIVLTFPDSKTAKATFAVESLLLGQEDALANTVVVQEEERIPEKTKQTEPEQKTLEPPLSLAKEAAYDPITPKKKSPLLLILLVCALLFALGILVYKNWPKDAIEEPKSEETQTKVEKQKEPKKEEAKKEMPKAAESPLKKSKEKTVEERVSEFFKDQNRSASGAASLAKSLAPKTSDEQDAVFRLLYFASERGDQSVLMEYAACLDPTKDPWGSIGKDAPEAYALYEKVAGADPKKASYARKAQDALRLYLEQEKSKGNMQAEKWLRIINAKAR